MHHPALRAAVAILLVGLAHCAYAEEPPPVKLRGEIVDPALYLREGRHGSELEANTYEAVDGGQTLALLEEGTGALYLFLAAQPGEDPNELIYDYVNEQVTITGTVYERGGLKGIVPTAVEPVTPPAAASSSKTPDQIPSTTSQ